MRNTSLKLGVTLRHCCAGDDRDFWFGWIGTERVEPQRIGARARLQLDRSPSQPHAPFRIGFGAQLRSEHASATSNPTLLLQLARNYDFLVLLSAAGRSLATRLKSDSMSDGVKR